MMALFTFNARTLASEACIEDLMMQARKITYDVIGLTETRRHRRLHAVFETGEKLFLGGVVRFTRQYNEVMDATHHVYHHNGRNKNVPD
ncbi:hypothetical protein V3C99_013096 [Haemonchus contortus]|uniref:Endonuclease/exonuclease/phosphatase n=1 Tax=Haemonchus contortus TaxID=6289 RepID=A0A7I5E715_HAECO